MPNVTLEAETAALQISLNTAACVTDARVLDYLYRERLEAWRLVKLAKAPIAQLLRAKGGAQQLKQKTPRLTKSWGVSERLSKFELTLRADARRRS